MKIIADFNATGLERILAAQNDQISVDPQPYGQFIQSIYDCIENGYDDVVVLWLNLESFSKNYSRALKFLDYDLHEMKLEFELYLELIQKLAKQTKGVIVCNFCMPAHFQGSGLNNLSEGNCGYLLADLNLMLYKHVSKISNAWCLDQTKWFQRNSFYNGKLYHAGKIPFSQGVFQDAAEDIIASIEAIRGQSKKLLVLDLDNTLWGGILGDDGSENIKLGPPSAVGEAFVAFQAEIKALKNRGIILAIASKNYEETALAVLKDHPEMQLRIEDFSAWRINWDDKAENILRITNELNLGLSSVVFIDDNAAERGRVAEALPEVSVPEWPNDPCDYVVALRRLNYFSVTNTTEEDAQKSNMLLQDKQREKQKKLTSSKDEWLKSLEMKLTIESVDSKNVVRITQLLNKTNQFNLRTRRLTQGELDRWLDEGNEMFAFRVSDRFGDMGLTGIVGLELQSGSAVISDFVMSCRVMGRNIEIAMLNHVTHFALSKGFDHISIQYEQTSKNKPILDFFCSIGLLSENLHSGFASVSSCKSNPNYFEIGD